MGTLWSLVTCAGLGAVGIALHMGFEAPIAPDPAAVASWNVWAGGAGILGSLGVALTYEWLRESTLRDLAAAQRRANEAHAQQIETESQFRVQLEQLVEDRTQALIESREQLRRADRLASVGTLAAGVAHQINNPVGAILLGAQYALGSGDDPGREQIYREALESSADNAKRCGYIVQNLLRFARNDSTEKTLLDLNDITRESISGLGEVMNRFDLMLCEDRLPIVASGIEIEQVIVNLAQNALESGQPASRAVDIHTELRGDLAILHVTDHGHGIKDDDRERIFDPFFTTRISEGGTGLGLSLVHEILQEHGGIVEVHSKLGEGTRFSISLPIHRA